MKELFLKGEYKEVINSYLQNKGSLSEEDCFYAISSYVETGKYIKAFREYLDTCRVFPGHTLSDNAAAWAVYEGIIKPFDIRNGNIDNLLKLVDFALQRCSKEEPSPRVRIVERIADALFCSLDRMDRNRRYELLEHYLKQVKPSELSDRKRLDPVFHDMEVDSFRYDWFIYYTVMLYNTGRYVECIAMCDRALREAGSLDSDDYSFEIRKAQALSKIGRYDKALSIMKDIEDYVHHWFKYRAYMHIYADMKDVDKTMWAISKGALYRRPHAERIYFYEDAADALMTAGDTDLATLHAKFAVKLHEETGSKPDKDFNKMYIMEDLDLITLDKVADKLTPLWLMYSSPVREDKICNH